MAKNLSAKLLNRLSNVKEWADKRFKVLSIPSPARQYKRKREIWEPRNAFHIRVPDFPWSSLGSSRAQDQYWLERVLGIAYPLAAINEPFLGPRVPDFPGSMKARGKFGTLGGLKGTNEWLVRFSYGPPSTFKRAGWGPVAPH